MDSRAYQERLIMKLCASSSAKCRRRTLSRCLPVTKTSETSVQRRYRDEQTVVGKTARCRGKKCNAVRKKLRQIEEETGLTIEQVKDINRRMSIGEGKPAVRRKRWLKRTCVWLFLSPRNTPTVACSS